MKRDLYVNQSGIEGKGVFTKKSFQRGQTIFLLKGCPVDFVVSSEKDSDVGPNWVGVGKNKWRDVGEDGVVRYINHSCNPNMGIKGSCTFVALRDIQAGEELTFDYSITEEDQFWKMKNSEPAIDENHRHTIQSIQSLPLETYEKYLPYVPKYFQKVYEKHHGLRGKKGQQK
ncbi:MAG: hypothetical protein RL150_734 [Candidatus Parcubacteria bacterium]|jgi:hypothetical protein